MTLPDDIARCSGCGAKACEGCRRREQVSRGCYQYPCVTPQARGSYCPNGIYHGYYTTAGIPVETETEKKEE